MLPGKRIATSLLFIGTLMPMAVTVAATCTISSTEPASTQSASPTVTTGKTLSPIIVTAIGLSHELLDANPRYLFAGGPNHQRYNADQYLSDAYLGNLSRDNTGALRKRLLAASDDRTGVAADGLSQLLVRLQSTTAGAFELTNTPAEEDGSLRVLFNGDTCQQGDAHFGFALYTAPQAFGRGSGMRPPANRIADGPESRSLALEFEFQPAATDTPSQTISHAIELQIARAPVVLMHGTFDDPVSAWATDSPYGDRFVDTLTNAGFVPFLVNYQSTNTEAFELNRTAVWDGGSTGASWLSAAGDWKAGGIEASLTYYRDNLTLAATRADVIGHSMGGLLARVYASQQSYNDQYHRRENYNRGDIHRLITISTPHYGSEMAELVGFLTERDLDGNLLTDILDDLIDGTALSSSLSARIDELKLSYGAWFETGRHDGSSALSDQTPGSPALQMIDTPDLPIHVFATTTDIGRLKDPIYDPDKTVFYRASLIAGLFFKHPDVAERYLQQVVREDWTEHNREPVFVSSRESFLDLLASNAHHWATEPDRANDIRSWFDSRELPELTLEAIRQLVFRFDENDTTVRLDSQLGGRELSGAERSAISYFGISHDADVQESVIHGFAPRYYRLQHRIVDVLKSPTDTHFATLGAGGQPMPPHTPERIGNDFRLTGSHAKAWSGMAPSHVDAFLNVARDRNAIIMMRPVNPDATQLIVQGAATKGMNIKGKSSNWGPQKGYLPQNQTFSKLWRNKQGAERTAAIEDFNKKTQALLDAKDAKYRDPDNGKPLAISRQLEHRWPANTTDDNYRRYTVWYDKPEKGPITDAEAAIFLCKSDGTQTPDTNACDCEAWLDWRTDSNTFNLAIEPSTAREPGSCRSLQPLNVLADNTHPDKPFLTADYDILTTGFYCPDGTSSPDPACRAEVTVSSSGKGKCDAGAMVIRATFKTGRRPVPMPCFDEQTGLITEEQKKLLRLLNTAVQEQAGYTGGKVSHHGPETQFFESPYVDYPITVFDPRYRTVDENGESQFGPEVISIPRGPKGFRDVYLKRYYETKIDQGYWLYPNEDDATANWKWRRIESAEGDWLGYHYVDDSSLKITDDTDEIPPPECVNREMRRQQLVRRGLSTLPPRECGFDQ